MRSWPHPYLPPTLSSINHPQLRVRDSYTEKFHSLPSEQVSLYVCGITPYDATHLGHAATYLTFDLINRYLTASKCAVRFAENITDIDDPLFERAKRDGLNWQSLAQSQIDLFISDMTELRVIPPDSYQGVIESMAQIISAVERMVNSGLTYAIHGDHYLDLGLVGGALDNLPLSLDEAITTFAARGGDPERSGKRHPLDPLLWKGKVAGEPSWAASFGEGRPGWHIECVAIALAALPDCGTSSISIQGGGADLRFPHHYMTSVQSQALTGKPFASTYLHCGMIGLDGEKMSKSKGNLRFVSGLISEGRSPMAIRSALINRHYRSDLMWTDAILDDNEDFIARTTINLSRTEVAPTLEVVQKIVSALADDLDTPTAFAAIEEWNGKTEAGATGGEAGELSRALDLYLGLAF